MKPLNQNNMEQTAVEWLEERFEKFLAYYEGHHKSEIYSIHQLSNDFEQAKEMEDAQIKNDFRAGWHGNKHKDWNCEFYLIKHMNNKL